LGGIFLLILRIYGKRQRAAHKARDLRGLRDKVILRGKLALEIARPSGLRRDGAAGAAHV